MNSELSITHSLAEFMAALSADEWLRLRSAINHDWLRNGFIPALNAARNTVRGLIRNPQFGQASWASLISDWHTHTSALSLLVGSAEHALSPARLFDAGTLGRAPFAPPFRAWARSLVHQLWKRRVSLDAHLARAQMTLQHACSGAAFLEKAIGTSSEGEAVSAFLESVRELSAALSALPQRLEVL